MRLITHTDLDGVICAVLICSVEQIDEVKFIDPGTIQARKLAIKKEDILADLPYDSRVGIWFDHHESSKPKQGQKFEGAWSMAPSAARVIFDYYENPYLDKFGNIVKETDRIDSGGVTLADVENPQGLFLISNTFETTSPKSFDDRYRRHVIGLLREQPDIEKVLADASVKERCANFTKEAEIFKAILLESTKVIGNVAFSDLRQRPDLPRGNNYIVYSLFPQCTTSVRLMPLKEEKDSVKLSVGHNVFGKKSDFDVGTAMKKIGGGGHRAVGGATISKEDAEKIAMQIVEEINSSA